MTAKVATGLHQTLGELRVAFGQAVLLEVDLMARIPKIWFRKDRKCWQVTIRGVRHNLGPNKKDASHRFHQLMGTAHHKPLISMSFAAIADAFLEWVKTNRAASTYEGNRFHIERFCQRYPDLQLAELRPYHCQQWVDAHPGLAQTTRRIYLKAIRRLVNWAIQQGYISNDPLRGLQIPASARREVCITKDKFDQMLELIDKDWFRRLCIVAFETGCRPQELLRVEARHYDPANSRWVFPVSESKGKRHPRVVYLSPKAEAITRQLADQYPEGRLFRNDAGKVLIQQTVASAFYRLRITLGRITMKDQGISRDDAARQELVRRGDKRSLDEMSSTQRRLLDRCAAAHFAPLYCLYSLRHSFATIALQSGLDGLTVAILLGHRDPSMLAKVYQHLSHNPDHLLRQVRKAAED